jgi:hypothetical protein
MRQTTELRLHQKGLFDGVRGVFEAIKAATVATTVCHAREVEARQDKTTYPQIAMTVRFSCSKNERL